MSEKLNAFNHILLYYSVKFLEAGVTCSHRSCDKYCFLVVVGSILGAVKKIASNKYKGNYEPLY
jgi:hypothetical protein